MFGDGLKMDLFMQKSLLKEMHMSYRNVLIAHHKTLSQLKKLSLKNGASFRSQPNYRLKLTAALPKCMKPRG